MSMSSSSEANSPDDRLDYWKGRWRDGHITFHKTEVNASLQKHIDKLLPDRKAGRVFVPLCGKTKDMKWFHDLGVPVVGVEVALVSLEEFFSESGLEYQEEEAPQLGHDGKLLRTTDGSIKLYCGDALIFDENLAGTFEAVWDRGSLVALNREDTPLYAKIIKKLMKPGAVCLLEVVDYDVKMFAGSEVFPKIPPPYPMNVDEVKSLYEPECTVEQVDRTPVIFHGKDAHVKTFVITKTAH